MLKKIETKDNVNEVILKKSITPLIKKRKKIGYRIFKF